MDEKEINAILEEENDINAVIDLDAITGPKGDDGLSAYEVAKENGFEGTEEEWLESLKQGPKGEDGVGIESVELTSTDGLIDTHTITYTDGSTSNFDVRNGEDGKDFTYDDFTIAQLEALKGQDGRGIVSIEKTGTEGLVDTYTITYTDGTTSTYTVSNGEDGEDGQGYIDTSDFVTFDHFDSTLEGYATQEDIDNAVEQIDLTGYATTEYVDSAVENVEVDLNGYATTEYVDTAVNNAIQGIEPVTLDDEVTEQSTNGVKSSGIHDALERYLGYAVSSSQSIVNSKIQYSSTDLEAGVSELETGVVYLVYEE